jgi:hypothetical protein
MLCATASCGILPQNKVWPKLAESDRLGDQADFGSKIFSLTRLKALSGAGFAKVDFAKSCFQRT